MTKTLIKLAYRQIIDASSTGSFEKKIFNDSYSELLMKIQAYNPGNKYSTFSEIVAQDGRANSLHYKCSFAVLHHIETLKNKIPGLQETAGRMAVPFILPEFKVLESGINDKSLHKVAVIYITEPFRLVNSFGEYLLLANADLSSSAVNPGLEAFTVKMQENLSVIYYEEINAEKQITFSEA